MIQERRKLLRYNRFNNTMPKSDAEEIQKSLVDYYTIQYLPILHNGHQRFHSHLSSTCHQPPNHLSPSPI